MIPEHEKQRILVENGSLKNEGSRDNVALKA